MVQPSDIELMVNNGWMHSSFRLGSFHKGNVIATAFQKRDGSIGWQIQQAKTVDGVSFWDSRGPLNSLNEVLENYNNEKSNG